LDPNILVMNSVFLPTVLHRIKEKTGIKSMKHAFVALLLTIAAPQAFSASIEKTPTMDKVAEATAAQGFSEVSARKPKDPFYSSKRADAKTWMSIDAYPQGKLAKQVAVSCNQCRSRKMSEELSLECFSEVQKLASSLAVNLPGGVIKAFEGKEPEETWELKDQAAKKVRFQRTALKCDMGPGGSGIRFDIFYTK
jgi:hypothetical protein